MAEQHSTLDELANILYRADMKAEGDPLVYKWDALGEPRMSKYRAMATAAQSYAGGSLYDRYRLRALAGGELTILGCETTCALCV